jgi:hypothetical protein
MLGATHACEACDCGHVRNRKDDQLSRASPVVVGVRPMGVTPCLVELEDAESGRVRTVQCDDAEIVIEGAESVANADESPEPEV